VAYLRGGDKIFVDGGNIFCHWNTGLRFGDTAKKEIVKAKRI
jgi:hypothetical protein